MIIKTKTDAGRTTYYKYMGLNGKPITGARGDAATFPPEQAKKVLSHLATIDHRFAEAELVDG